MADDGMAVSARLVTSRILAGVTEEDLAVTITAPNPIAEPSTGRSPLSLAIVIDRSGSMHGPAIENAKAAALSVLRQLDDRDAFSVVTYSSSSETVLPMQRATDENKTAARAAIESIYDDGGTCISCGLETGAAEIARTPVNGGLRRILLISDGQANEGLYDRDELAQLAANKAARGVSISAVGVGLDFDEATMRRLAEVGRGSYSFVEDTVALSAMFLRELGNLSHTVASEVRLVATAGPGIRIEEAYGYPMARADGGVIVPVADMRAGETRKVVFRVTVAAAHPGPLVISQVEVGWHRVSDGVPRAARATAEVDVVDDPAAVAASVDPATISIVEKALSARALEEARAAYDNGGVTRAKQVLDRRSQVVRANAAYLGAEAVESLEAVSRDAIEGFAKAPAQAKKATSVKAYELAR
ncbi:MAG TPA: VWA domain-containing protein [Kofleriaceae bacterium]|nr:VWA domain-containing protein [Kofleriaceae bacterium]